MTYDLLSLLLWTAVVAVLFGLIQFGRAHWQWSLAIADWDYLDAMPIMGIFSAMIATLWLWALFDGPWPRCHIRLLFASLAIAGLAVLLPYLTRWATGRLGVLGAQESIVLATVQSVILLSSFTAFRGANSESLGIG